MHHNPPSRSLPAKTGAGTAYPPAQAKLYNQGHTAESAPPMGRNPLTKSTRSTLWAGALCASNGARDWMRLSRLIRLRTRLQMEEAGRPSRYPYGRGGSWWGGVEMRARRWEGVGGGCWGRWEGWDDGGMMVLMRGATVWNLDRTSPRRGNDANISEGKDVVTEILVSNVDPCEGCGMIWIWEMRRWYSYFVDM